MSRFKRALLHICCLGWDLTVAWPMVLIVWLFWGTDLRWENGVLKCRFKENRTPKWYRGWGGTSIGNGQIYGWRQLLPRGEKPTSIMIHEDHHTVQARASQVAATITALILAIVIAATGAGDLALGVFLGVWILGGNAIHSVGGWLSAVLEGRKAYRGSAHEIGAYAVGDLYTVGDWAQRENWEADLELVRAGVTAGEASAALERLENLLKGIDGRS